MTPQRIQLRRTKGWRKPEGAVVVARPSKWGNPFFVEYPLTAATAVQAYRHLIVDRVVWVEEPDGTRHRFPAERAVSTGWPGREKDAPTLAQIRAELAGRDLACWCRLDQPCHADVLLEIANAGASA